MRQTTILLLTVVAGLFLFASAASADMIPGAINGVTATGFHEGDNLTGNGSIETAVTGRGLTVGDPRDSTTWTHSTGWQDDWQGVYTAGWMVLDLGSIVSDLESMYIWNVNENTHTDRGVATMDVYYTNDPTVTPPATSGTVQPYDFSSGGWTPLGSTVSVPEGGTNISEIVDVSAIPEARYIGLDLLTNHGAGDRVGVAEVQFTTVVPEPSTLVLAALGLLGLAICGRRRKR